MKYKVCMWGTCRKVCSALLAALSLAACDVETMPAGPDEEPAAGGKADDAMGEFVLADLDADNPSMEGRIPISHLGCPMGGLLTLTLEDDSAVVEVNDLKYYAGHVEGFDKRRPEKTRKLWGAVRGEALDAELRKPGLLGVEGWFANTRETSATIMLIQPDTARVTGSGCDHVRYGTHQIEGDAYLSLQLSLVEGDSATVGYHVEWFDCLSSAPSGDPRKDEVCEMAWDELNGKLVGKEVETSTCPWPGDTRWCSIWDGALGRQTQKIDEDDVRSAVGSMCRDNTILDSKCCD